MDVSSLFRQAYRIVRLCGIHVFGYALATESTNLCEYIPAKKRGPDFANCHVKSSSGCQYAGLIIHGCRLFVC